MTKSRSELLKWGHDLTCQMPSYPGILVQPGCTIGCSLDEIRTHDRKFFDALIPEVMQFKNLHHAGTLSHKGEENPNNHGGVTAYRPCGGKLRFCSSNNPEYLNGFNTAARSERLSARINKAGKQTNWILTCDNPDCDMVLWFTRRELVIAQSDMLHLMLKQASPLHQLSMRTCNFAYCGRKDDAQIRSLGTISLATGVMRGYLDDWATDHEPPQETLLYCAMCFMLVPGMDTLRTSNLFETWIEALEEWMHHHQMGSLDIARRLQFGPKPLDQ